MVFWVEVEELLQVCRKRWVILSLRWYFNEVMARGSGLSFVDTLGIGTVEWRRMHVGELKSELRRTKDCPVVVW